MKKGDKKIQITIDTVNSFMNVFAVSDKDKLYSLSSGAFAPPDITADVMKAEHTDT